MELVPRQNSSRVMGNDQNNLMFIPMELVRHQNSSGVMGNDRNNLTFRIYLGAASPYFGLWAVYYVGAY
jgi:hypothetical protein